MDSFTQCYKYIYIAAAITGAFSVYKTGEVSLRQTFLISFIYAYFLQCISADYERSRWFDKFAQNKGSPCQAKKNVQTVSPSQLTPQ